MAELHVVEELHFEVDFDSEDLAFDTQERVAAFAQGRALHIVDEVFSQAQGGAGAALNLQLDRLELDLGVVEPAELEHLWEQRLRERLWEVLAALPTQTATDARGSVHPGLGAPPEQPPPLREPGAAGAATWVEPLQADQDSLLHFLRLGSLPWHRPRATDPRALAERVWQHRRTSLLRGLRALPEPATAARRLVRQFPAAWCADLELALLGVASATAWPAEPARAERRLLAALSPGAMPMADEPVGSKPRPAAAPHPGANEAGAPPGAAAAPWAAGLPRAVRGDPAPAIGPASPTGLRLDPPAPHSLHHHGEAADAHAPAAQSGEARRTPPGGDAALARALRRLAALLVDDAPSLTEADLAELLAVWQPLLQQDPSALRDTLQRLGRRVRVRRRMARLWPEALLRQVAALFADDAALPESPAWPHAKGRTADGAAGSAARRLRWEALLQRLWVGDGNDAPGHARTREGLIPTPDTTPDLVALLAQHLPPLEAQALADLASSPWPTLERPGDLARLTLPELARLAVQALSAAPASAAPLDQGGGLPSAQSTAPAAGATTARIVEHWWKALATQLGCPAPVLLVQLHEPAADGHEAARRRAWARWLPAPGALGVPSGVHADAAATAAAVTEASEGRAPSTRAALDSLLSRRLPAHEAAELAALAFTPLPSAWWAGASAPDGSNPFSAGFCRSAWQAAGSAGTGIVSAHAVATQWCSVLAVQLQQPAATLLACLHDPCLDEAEAARRRAWARWLPPPPTSSALSRLRAQLAAGAPARVDDDTRARFGADWASSLADDPAALRSLVHQASREPEGRLQLARLSSDPVWQQLLHLLQQDEPAYGVWHGRLDEVSHEGTPPALTTATQSTGPGPAERLLARATPSVAPSPAPLAAAEAEPPPVAQRLRALSALQPPAEADAGTDASRRLAAALRGGDPAAVRQAWVHWQAVMTPEAQSHRQPAREALSHLLRAEGSGPALARALDPPAWQGLLAWWLSPADAPLWARLEQALARLANDHAGSAHEITLALRQHVLAHPSLGPGFPTAAVADPLLDGCAQTLGLSPTALRQALLALDPALAALTGTALAPVPIAAPPRRPVPGKPWPGESRRPDEADPLHRVVAWLRDSAGAGAPVGELPGLLQALIGQPPARSRLAQAALQHELESAAAAGHLAQSLPAPALLQLLAWLRPAEADALQALWPKLQALATQHRPPGWPGVAQALLRELFEEGRPLHAEGCLRRVEQALSPAARARPAAPDPQALRTPATGPSPSAAPPAAPAALPTPVPSLAWRPDGPLFVGNAGLVLLAPFLQRLFGLLGLLHEEVFVDSDAAERAVALIQHAATGEASAPEPWLPLNKLLCGLPLQAPLRREVTLEPKERAAVDGMLAAVISHWSALGQTSLAGLRQTFLQREGRLEHKLESWQLEVPNQTFDMLIDRLPWGYSTIRYPWMPEVLHVHWR